MASTGFHDQIIAILPKLRVQALRWYNALLLPLGLLMQRRLEWGTGLIDVAGVGELLLACRRR